MITLIHLLQHLGIPSGVAIAIVIAVRKVLTGGVSRVTGAKRGRERRRRCYR